MCDDVEVVFYALRVLVWFFLSLIMLSDVLWFFFFFVTRRFITFQDFADWYTTVGHEMVPWLELLDIKKWPKEEDPSKTPDELFDMDDSEDEDKEYQEDEEYQVR